VFSNIRGLSASVLSGMSVPQDPNFNCPSGNRTWDAYETLGIFSSCEDFGEKAQKNCAAVGDTDSELFAVYCDYNLPTAGGDITLSTVSRNNDFAGATILNSTVEQIYSRVVFTRIGILRVDYGEYTEMRNHPGNYTDVPKSIHVCELAWCSKKYESARVNNGVLEERLQRNPPPLQDTPVFQTAWMENCTEDGHSSLDYKTLGDPELDLLSPRLFDLFRDCPDIIKISEEENIYIVNSNDEDYIMWVLLACHSICLIYASFTNSHV
jgi:hypothetical protein